MNTLLARLQACLVDDWRDAWRWSSIRLHAAVLLVAALYEIMPVLSPEIATMLPASSQAKAIGAYAIIGVVFRVSKLKPNG